MKLAVSNQGKNTIHVVMVTGTGTFGLVTPIPLPVGSFPESVAVGDFNGDGRLDLAVANGGSTTVSIDRGRGVERFGAAMPCRGGMDEELFGVVGYVGYSEVDGGYAG